MSTGLKAEHLTIKAIFSSPEVLRLPPYQRGYSWSEKEAGELLNDLLEAMDTARQYFLGAIVVIQERPKEAMEIVDGQQRLATLSILFAVLRDMATTREEANRLHEVLESPGRAFPPQAPHWRLTLNHIDSPIFRETVLKRGATLNASLYESESGDRLNIVENLTTFQEALKDINSEQRQRLAHYILNNTLLVRVVVTDRDGGYGAYRVLNTRGKQPSASDILKSDLFERAGFSDVEAEAHSAVWNEIGQRLGPQGFDDLLKQIRSLFDRAPSKEDMVTGYRNTVLNNISARGFVDDKLPRYADAYEILSSPRRPGIGVSQNVAKYIDFMRALEHSGWRAPALKYLVDGDLDDAKATAYFKALERLAYTLQFVVTDREARLRRYRRIITAISDGDNLYGEDSPLSLKPEEKTKLSERLVGRFATFRQRKAMSLRINALLPGGRAISLDADATLEHILPRNPKANSQWLTIWKNAGERRELVDCLGNFTLLKNAENQEADRQDFQEKKVVFFRNGAGSYRMSHDLQAIDSWTPDVVRKRRDYFADLLRQEWDL